jgi:26S proteasome regulatory subunit T6
LNEKLQDVRRLEAQRNELNAKGVSITSKKIFTDSSVRLLREELTLLQEPASYVGEVAKVMSKSKVLVKVGFSHIYYINFSFVSCFTPLN